MPGSGAHREKGGGGASPMGGRKKGFRLQTKGKGSNFVSRFLYSQRMWEGARGVSMVRTEQETKSDFRAQ